MMGDMFGQQYMFMMIEEMLKTLMPSDSFEGEFTVCENGPKRFQTTIEGLFGEFQANYANGNDAIDDIMTTPALENVDIPDPEWDGEGEPTTKPIKAFYSKPGNAVIIQIKPESKANFFANYEKNGPISFTLNSLKVMV